MSQKLDKKYASVYLKVLSPLTKLSGETKFCCLSKKKINNYHVIAILEHKKLLFLHWPPKMFFPHENLGVNTNYLHVHQDIFSLIFF
jgi:hypothetical protein